MVRAFSIITYTWLVPLNCRNDNFCWEKFKWTIRLLFPNTFQVSNGALVLWKCWIKKFAKLDVLVILIAHHSRIKKINSITHYR